MPGGNPGGLKPGGGPGIPGGANGMGGRAKAGWPTIERGSLKVSHRLAPIATTMMLQLTWRHHTHATTGRHTTSRAGG
jgi:hypothetical protein